MRRGLAFLYGLICYVIFLVSFLYAIGFVGDVAVPKTVNTGSASPVGSALVVNVLLLGLFAVQHSVMARDGFKKWWTNIVPQPVERSTYVLFTSLILLLLYWQWRPLRTVVWEVQEGWASALLWGIFGLGWLIVLLSTFMIDHFGLFGLRQVWSYLRGKEFEYPSFQAPGFYKYVRHPLMFGFLLAFWAIPTMTAGHLLFAVMTTAYILVGIWFEERDLIRRFGDRYRRYRRNTPMLIPWPTGTTVTQPSDEEESTTQAESS